MISLLLTLTIMPSELLKIQLTIMIHNQNDELTLMRISALAIITVMTSQLAVPVQCLPQVHYHLDFINGRMLFKDEGQ